MTISFNGYQEEAGATAIYPDRGHNIYYVCLGLAGESGEICEKVKKIMRDDDGEITDEKKELLKKELGDCLWYISQIAFEIGVSMEDIAEENIKKLSSRKERNVLKGSGDNR